MFIYTAKATEDTTSQGDQYHKPRHWNGNDQDFFDPRYCFIQCLVNSGRGMTSLHCLCLTLFTNFDWNCFVWLFLSFYKFPRKLFSGSAIGLYQVNIHSKS